MCDNTGINYANGVCGKDKNGKLYIITNNPIIKFNWWKCLGTLISALIGTLIK